MADELVKCLKCGDEFGSQSALDNHTAAKHGPWKGPTKMQWIIFLFAIVVAVIGIVVITQPQQQNTVGGSGVKGESNNVIGAENATVKIIEFSDFQCPFCGRVEPTIKQVLSNYQGKVSIQYKHFPLSIHPFAQKAAEASECAADQGKFWEYHDMLFQNQESLAVTNLKEYAKALGLNQNEFNTCLDSGQKASVVRSDFAEGNSAGVQGTPAFFINGQLLSGAQPYEAFKKVIDSKLQ